jgi:REP element-mobilizing transposase RayT
MSAIKLQYGLFYHLCNRGNNKEALFKEDQHYYYFLDLYRKYMFPLSDLYAYCLLPTHFHFLLRIKDKEELNGIYTQDDQPWKQMRNFLGTYTKAINHTYHRTGHLFQGRYASKIIPDDDYFFRLIVYIHQNPQSHGIVSDFRIWPFSSYTAYRYKDGRSNITNNVFSDPGFYNTIMEMHNTPTKVVFDRRVRI